MPGKWHSDEPGTKATIVVDAETFALRRITSEVPGLFTQTVEHVKVEQLRAGRAVNTKLRMRAHRR